MLREYFIIITEVPKQKLPVLVVLAQNQFDSVGMEKKQNNYSTGERWRRVGWKAEGGHYRICSYEAVDNPIRPADTVLRSHWLRLWQALDDALMIDLGWDVCR